MLFPSNPEAPRRWSLLTLVLALSMIATVVLSQSRIARLDAQMEHERAVTAAYKATLNNAQRLLTQRGNEIARCVDDNEEMANRLAEGIRCPRRGN